jgi:hypothetical protein
MKNMEIILENKILKNIKTIINKENNKMNKNNNDKFKKDMLTYNEVKALLAQQYNNVEFGKEKNPPEAEKHKNSTYRDDLELNQTESQGNPSGTTG